MLTSRISRRYIRAHHMRKFADMARAFLQVRRGGCLGTHDLRRRVEDDVGRLPAS